MTSALLLLMLCQVPADAPLKPPELVDKDGNISVITGVEPLEPGTVCLTHEKAVIERDTKVRKQARLEVLEAGSGIDWPLILGVAGGGVALALVTLGIGFAVGKGGI